MLRRGLPEWTGQSLKQGGRVVGHNTEAFVGIDTSKLRNAIAIADGGRGGEVRYLGEFPATEAAIRKLVAKLAAKYRHLTFCYEAGDYDVATHFTPRYNPWDQRLCLVPDGDLFKAIKQKRASVVTNEIDTFTENGIRL